MTNPHLKTGVDSTPESCKKHYRQWILSNKFILQIKYHCHKHFELHNLMYYDFTGREEDPFDRTFSRSVTP